MPAPVRVLVVDDDQFIRNAIRWLLTPAPDLQLVGEITNLAELPTWCSQTKPQLLLIGGGSPSLFREIPCLTQGTAPQCRLIALLPAPPAPPLNELLAIPLHGCCFQREIDENLLHILRAVAGGSRWFSCAVLEQQSVRTIHAVLAEQGYALTETEEQLVVMLTQGLRNGEIADALGLAYQTVSNYLKVIYSKLGTNQRAEVVRRFHGAVFVPWGK